MLRQLISSALFLCPALAWSAPVAYDRKQEKQIEVRALDDPGNPYREQYADWDRWVIQHSLTTTGGEAPLAEDRFANYYVLQGRVDATGWLLPQLEWQRALCEWNRDNDFNITRIFTYEFDAGGTMDEAMLRAFREAIARVRAPYYPVVPEWLVKKCPLYSMILPDGRVLASPEAGRQDWPGLVDWQVPDSHYRGWELYSAAGELQSVTLPNSWWWEATIPDFRQLIDPYRQPMLNIIERRGRVHVYLMDGNATSLANFDWVGTPLPANLKLQEDRDGNPFLGIHGFDLATIYTAQQELTHKPTSGL